MSLPLSDSALIGTCLAASALGLLVLTSSGGNSSPQPPEPAANAAPAAPATNDALAQLGATAVGDLVEVEPEFAAKVRSYLMQNPAVILEALDAQQQRDEDARAEMSRAVIAAYADDLFNDPNSWVGGNPDGDVAMVAFIDYRCGFCKRAHDEIDTLLGTDDNLRLIVKEFPILGPESELASRFAIAALALGGDETYAIVHDRLMRYDDAITIEMLAELASDVDLDFDAVAVEMDSARVNETIEANYTLASMLEIRGTPSFVIEDELIPGFVDAATLIAIASSKRD